MNTLFSNMVVALAALASVTATETVILGTAGNYVILTKTGISTVPDSVITGDIAVSPIAAIALTGFSLTMGDDETQKESAQVTGKAFASDFATPTPATLTTAVSDMETAFTDAAGRPNPNAEKINYGAGLLGGDFGGSTTQLETGVYTFDGNVIVGGELFFDGSNTDIFIIQVAGNVNFNAKVTLQGGALAKNIFWQVSGFVTVAAGKHVQGIILCKTKVDFITGSSLNGRILSQTAANLQSAIITQPV
mmetsp:Transcript_22028/g.37208  ORF Transcript_22028/g.37208 Transcript_22028/m.37208 type:complete len:249 (-) Transcript_22028:213-959(-)